MIERQLSGRKGTLLKEGEIPHWGLPFPPTYVMTGLSFCCFENVLTEFL